MKKALLISFLTLFLLSPVLSLKAADPEDPVELDLKNDTKFRWGDDRLIYGGEVNAYSWPVQAGYDDDAIDVEYFAGDTLRAVVACRDSIVRIFRSNNNGQTWSYVSGFLSSYNITEPHIVHGTDSTYHVFVRYLYNPDRIYTRAYRTRNDSYITGTYISGSDSVKNYSVCTNRKSTHAYRVFVAYHSGLGGPGRDQIMLTQTTDQGQNWSTPVSILANGSGFPDITYGNYNILYVAYLYRSGNNYNIQLRRSLNFGTSWDGSVVLQADTYPKMGPQIAAAYDYSGNVWTIWPRKNLLSVNDDWDLIWSRSQDSAITWSTPAVVNSVVDSNEVLPSIAVNDVYGSTSATPCVSFVKIYYDWTGTASVNSFQWEGSTWGADTCRSDSNAFLTRPIQTFTNTATARPPAAIAYVGENAENVYFDSWATTSGINEDNDVTDSDGKIECSIDQSIITGTATLKYTLPEENNVNIFIVNILGQTVATLDNGEKEAGENTLNVSSENLPQGIYYIVIKTPAGTVTAKATVIK